MNLWTLTLQGRQKLNLSDSASPQGLSPPERCSEHLHLWDASGTGEQIFPISGFIAAKYALVERPGRCLQPSGNFLTVDFQ